MSAEQMERMYQTLKPIMPVLGWGNKDMTDAAIRKLNIMGGASAHQIVPLMWQKVPQMADHFNKPPSLRRLWKFLQENRTPPLPVPPVQPALPSQAEFGF